MLSQEDRDRIRDLLSEILDITGEYDYEETSYQGDPDLDQTDKVRDRPGDLEAYIDDARTILECVPCLEQVVLDAKNEIIDIFASYDLGCEGNQRVRDALHKHYGL